MTDQFDNDRDRFQYGYDAGTIVEGTVTWNESLNRFVIVDDNKVGFDPQVVLQKLDGKQIRMTIISFEAMETIENLMSQANPTKS